MHSSRSAIVVVETALRIFTCLGMQAELSHTVVDGGAEVVHVSADVSPKRDAEATASTSRSVPAIEPVEEDAPVIKSNPTFIQNVWDLPPQRGFYLEDIAEERTVDLAAQSGYLAQSSWMAQSTLDSLPHSAGDSVPSPGKYQFPNSEGSQHQQKNAHLSSSLHQSLQSSVEQDTLQDALSDV
jgi:hypothetical protein